MRRNKMRGRYNNDLSATLINDKQGIIGLEIVILLAFLFMPLISFDFTSDGGIKEYVSMGDMIVNPDLFESGHPGVYYLAIAGVTFNAWFFRKARKDGVDAALPYLIASAIGTILLMLFAFSLCGDGYEGAISYGYEHGTAGDIIAYFKTYFSVGLGVGFNLLIAMGGTGLSIKTYLDERA